MTHRYPHFRSFVLLSLLTLSATFAGLTSATTLYVGVGDGCDYGAVSGALNAAAAEPGNVEIRVTNVMEHSFAWYFGRPDSTGPILISGGWSSCTDASPFGRSTIVGPTDSAVLFSGGNVPRTITIRDIEVNQVSASRAVYVFDGIDVHLENTLIHGGSTGLTVHSAAATIDANTVIYDNQPASGVECATSQIQLSGWIRNNQATYGGGVRALTGCTVTLNNGARIFGNTALENGGGFSLESGAVLNGGSNSSSLLEAVAIFDNSAVRGGGLYARNPGTSVSTFNVTITNNRASLIGGGIVVRDSATFSNGRGSTATNCSFPPNCAPLSGNRLTTSTASKGSALYADGGASVNLRQLYIDSNSGFEGPPYGLVSSVVHAEGGGTDVTIEGAHLWDNEATYLFSAFAGANIDIGYSSTAENRWRLGTDSFIDVLGGNGTAGGSVSLYSSIFTDTRGHAGTVNGDCLIVDDDGGLQTAFWVTEADPQFVDPSGGDLHLQSTSPAIDYCDNGNPPLHRDIDQNTRGTDDPATPDNLGPYDLGMDEALPGSMEVLFQDGFESGNTSAWSVTTR